jgi:hypothetical protein
MRDGFFTRGHVIGNYFEKGPSSGDQKAVRIVGGREGGAFYLQDNISWDRPDSSLSERIVAGGTLASTLRTEMVFAPSNVSAMSSDAVRDYVLANAGARSRGLDRTDARLLAEVEARGGRLRDTAPSDGYDIPLVRSGLLDTDGDGVPNFYEDLIGSDKFVFDPHANASRSGYSNIEDYVNGLAAGAFPEPPSRPAAFTAEAEDLRLVSGFVVNASVNASGGALIRGGVGVGARAELLFEGPTGRYDITVRYVDENDGKARLRVERDGAVLDAWTWDANLGSAEVRPGTFTERVIRDAWLSGGQVVALAGAGDGGELLRVDAIRFAPAAATAAVAASRLAPQTLRVEAEDLALAAGFTAESAVNASGGAVILSRGGEAQADLAFTGPAGRYDIRVRYVDENDGASTMAVLVDGVAVDAWTWDATLSSPFLTPDTLRDRIVRDVGLEDGQTLSLRGWADAGERLRVDFVEVAPADGWA